MAMDWDKHYENGSRIYPEEMNDIIQAIKHLGPLTDVEMMHIFKRPNGDKAFEIDSDDLGTYLYGQNANTSLRFDNTGDLKLYANGNIQLNTTSGHFLKISSNAIKVGGDDVGIYIGTDDATSDVSVAVGYQSLFSEVPGTGGQNVALGYQSMYSNTQGWGNVAVGRVSLRANTEGHYNVAVGDHSLNANTSGYNNTAIGYSALEKNISGEGNVAVGSNSMTDNTTGESNTASGHYALRRNTTGCNNTTVGYDSLNRNTEGWSNSALGWKALERNLTGWDNTAIGQEALRYNTEGSNNVAVGNYSLYNNTTGNNNAAIGTGSLRANTSGNNNIAVGHEALYSNTYGTRNVAIGDYSLYYNLEGYNTAIGYDTLEKNTYGEENTAIGYEALNKNTVGYYNTAIGFKAGYTSTIASNCVYLGYKAGYSNTTDERLYINSSDSAYPLIYGEFNNDLVKIGNNSNEFGLTFDVHTAGTGKISSGGNIELNAASVIINSNLNMNTNAITGGGAGHDQFSDFVANEHIDHSGVSITAGTHLTGGGDITATRTLDVSDDWYDSVADIPTATPSDGDTTHLSTADHIYDFVSNGYSPIGHNHDSVYLKLSGGIMVGAIDFNSNNATNLNQIDSATDTDLYLNPDGTGLVKFGTYTADATASICGYITSKDDLGNTIYLACVTPTP